MIANKSSSEIDWAIIPDNPDTPMLDDYMNTDLQLDEWEDVVEDDVVINMQDEMDKTATRHATLQTTILCVILIFLTFFFSQIYCRAFGGSRNVALTAFMTPSCRDKMGRRCAIACRPVS